MATFDKDMLKRLHDLQEVSLRTEKHPEAPVTIWVVASGDEVYVRSVRAAKGRWFKDLAQGGDATLDISGRRVPVKAMDLATVMSFPAVPELKNPQVQAKNLLAIGAALRFDEVSA